MKNTFIICTNLFRCVWRTQPVQGVCCDIICLIYACAVTPIAYILNKYVLYATGVGIILLDIMCIAHSHYSSGYVLYILLLL
jgi:hypothetical protein